MLYYVLTHMAASTLDLGRALKFQGANARSAYPDTATLINNIVPNIYIAAGVVIFFMLILGGWNVLSSASDSHKMEEGKKIINFAIIGLLTVFASYWIIQIIQVVTGLQIL